MEKNEFLAKMKNARENLNSYAVLPYATYYCSLLKAFYKPSKKDKPMVTFVYKVLDGDYRNKEHRNFYHVWDDTAFTILIQDLENLGFPTDQIATMDQLIKVIDSIEAEGIKVSIRIYENVKKPQYTNTRIESVYEDGPEATPEVESEKEIVKEVVKESDPTPTSETESAATSDPEPEPEPEPEAQTDKTEEIDVGSKVKFKFKDKEKVGVIKSCADDGTSAKISSGGMLYSVKTENILELVKETA